MSSAEHGGTVEVQVRINTDGLSTSLGKARDTITDSADQTGKKAGDKLSEGLKKGIAAAGAAAGVAITASVVDAMGREAANDKVAAALALTPEQAQRSAKVAADVYKDAWGQSTEEAAAGVKAVMEQIDGMRAASEPDLKAVTEAAMGVASTFDVDVKEAANAAGTMMKTGMAKDASEAFDIIAAGFQQGVDKRGDYLDTLTEYSTQFRKLGIDGTTATGLLSQGLAAGARDADKVGDALKELSIRAIDGSKTTQAAYAALGFDAQQMASRFAAGGTAASGALSEVLGRLRSMKDPVAQSAAAVGLFGTQAEDLGAALYALDPSTATQGLGQVAGAAGKMNATVSDNAQAKVEGYRRAVQNLGVTAVEHTGSFGAMAAAAGSFAPALMQVLGPMAMMTAAWGASAGAALRATGAWLANTAALIANGVAWTALQAVAVTKFLVASAIEIGKSTIQWVANTAAMVGNKVAWLAVQAAAVTKFIALAAVELGKSTAAWLANTVAVVANRVAQLALVAVSAVVRAATVAWTAVQWLLNVALSANPIGIIIMAVAALVAGIIYAYKHSETFRHIVQAAGRAAAAAFGWVVEQVKKVWAALGVVIDWVKSHWPMLLAILTGPIGLAVLWIVKHWDTVMAFFKAVPGRIGGLFKTVANAITSPFRAAFNAVSRLWNSTIGKLSWTVPGWVPALGGHTLAAPKLPELQGLATGGSVVKAGAFWVGEHGPEVVNLPAGAAVTPNGGDRPRPNVTIHIHGGDLAEVRRVVDDAVDANNRRLVAGFRGQVRSA